MPSNWVVFQCSRTESIWTPPSRYLQPHKWKFSTSSEFMSCFCWHFQKRWRSWKFFILVDGELTSPKEERQALKPILHGGQKWNYTICPPPPSCAVFHHYSSYGRPCLVCCNAVFRSLSTSMYINIYIVMSVIQFPSEIVDIHNGLIFFLFPLAKLLAMVASRRWQWPPCCRCLAAVFSQLNHLKVKDIVYTKAALFIVQKWGLYLPI